MGMKTILIGLLFSLSFMSSVTAATLVCSGKIDRLSYHSPNKFMLKLSSMNTPVFFCSPDMEWKVGGTSYVTGAETCKTMYSTFLAIKMTDKSITSMYFDGDQVPSSCNSWESWRQANIRHYSM
jgi:hypothetical protein